MNGLDEFDRRLLDILQNDTTLSVNELAERVGLSATPCWRRVQRLNQAGYIKKRVALLDRDLLNVGITVFIVLKISQHNAEWVEQLRKTVQDIPEVLDFYLMSGDADYLIRAVVPDIKSYDRLYKKLISSINFTDVSSMFAMEEIKSTTAIPLEYAFVS